MKRRAKVYHDSTDQKKTEMAILTSNKINFRTKNITSAKYYHFIIRKGSMNQETITTLKDYAYNRASKYIEIKTDITKR